MEALSRVTEIPEHALRADAKLVELGLDSIQWVICLMDLEQLLGIELIDARNRPLDTVGQVCRLLEERASNPLR